MWTEIRSIDFFFFMNYLCFVGTINFFVTEFTMLILEHGFGVLFGGKIVQFISIFSFVKVGQKI